MIKMERDQLRTLKRIRDRIEQLDRQNDSLRDIFVSNNEEMKLLEEELERLEYDLKDSIVERIRTDD